MSQSTGDPVDAVAGRVLGEESRSERLWRRYGVLGWLAAMWGWWLLFIVAVRFVSANMGVELSVHWGVFAAAVAVSTGYAFYAHYW